MSDVDVVEPAATAAAMPATPAAPVTEPDAASASADDASSAPPIVDGRLRRGWRHGRHGRHGPPRGRRAAMACGVALLLALAVAVPSTFFLRKAHRMHRRALRDVLLLQSGTQSGGTLADAVLLAGATAKELDGDEYVLRVPKTVVDGVVAAESGGKGGAKMAFAGKVAAALVEGRGDLESVMRMVGLDVSAAGKMGRRGWGRGGRGRGCRRGHGRWGKGKGRRHGRRGHRRGHRGGRRRGWTDMFNAADDSDRDESSGDREKETAFDVPAADDTDNFARDESAKEEL